LHSTALQNLPKLGFFVWKYTIWHIFKQKINSIVIKNKVPVGVAQWQRLRLRNRSSSVRIPTALWGHYSLESSIS
jgi:hypothetical protein